MKKIQINSSAKLNLLCFVLVAFTIGFAVALATAIHENSLGMWIVAMLQMGMVALTAAFTEVA